MTDGYVGEQSENPPKSVSNAKLQDVGGKKKLGGIDKAPTQIGGYDNKAYGSTVSLARNIKENETSMVADEIAKKMADDAIERAKKRNVKP